MSFGEEHRHRHSAFAARWVLLRGVVSNATRPNPNRAGSHRGRASSANKMSFQERTCALLVGQEQQGNLPERFYLTEATSKHLYTLRSTRRKGANGRQPCAREKTSGRDRFHTARAPCGSVSIE
eukprot:350326-Chlamydomonas_euryale.AAC.3